MGVGDWSGWPMFKVCFLLVVLILLSIGITPSSKPHDVCFSFHSTIDACDLLIVDLCSRACDKRTCMHHVSWYKSASIDKSVVWSTSPSFYLTHDVGNSLDAFVDVVLFTPSLVQSPAPAAAAMPASRAAALPPAPASRSLTPPPAPCTRCAARSTPTRSAQYAPFSS